MITETPFKDLLILENPIYQDERGFFQELWQLGEIVDKIRRPIPIAQSNLSLSVPNTIRGLHAEPMDKIITPLTGKVFMAFVDLRKDQLTFGHTLHFKSDETDKRTFFLPEGVANSFCVYGREPAYYIYGVTGKYAGTNKRALAYNDPDLGIPWPIDLKKAILSDADRDNPTWRQYVGTL